MNETRQAKFHRPSPFQSQEGSVSGCLYILPARRRFIPNAWMLHAEGNQDGTRLVVYYTHITVTIEGKGLLALIDFLFSWELKVVQEGQQAGDIVISRIDIEDKNGEG